MTPAKLIVTRLIERKYPNARRYLFTREELVRLVAAVQRDALREKAVARG